MTTSLYHRAARSSTELHCEDLNLEPCVKNYPRRSSHQFPADLMSHGNKLREENLKVIREIERQRRF